MSEPPLVKEEKTPASLDQSEEATYIKYVLNNQFWLSRVIYLRFLGGVYLTAFLIAYHQNEALIGSKGLLPADKYLSRYSSHFNHDRWKSFFAHPTLFWFIEPSTDNINRMALFGCFLSILVVILASANVIVLFCLWAAYFSIVNVGQTWYSFGWESQLLETGFLAMLMVPVLSLHRYPQYTRTSWVGIWGNRYLLFRIMLGAGMIKIRGDECWRNLTCMNYFYQTQPVPNPFSIYFHNSPGKT